MATGIDVAASEIEKLHHVATLCNKRTKLAAWNDSVTSTSALRNLLYCFWYYKCYFTPGLNEGRCDKCWLRRYNCYCKSFDDIRHCINEISSGKNAEIIQTGQSIHVLPDVFMYYHYSEIGRSANTAHVLEALLSPSEQSDQKINCYSAIFGDAVAEAVLVQQMRPIRARIEVGIARFIHRSISFEISLFQMAIVMK